MARAQKGFTLLEVVVAFVVLALVLGSAFQVFSAGLSRASELDEYARALSVAQSKLAAAGMEQALQEGESAGDTADRRFHWTQRVTRHEELAEGQSAAPPANFSMYRVDVRVTWKSSFGRDRDLAMSTLTLGPKQP